MSDVQLEFQRFVIDVGTVVELAREGVTVYVCTTRHGETEVEIRVCSSEAAAERSLARRIQQLRKDDYLADGVVVRPRPAQDSREARKAAKLTARAQARERFDAGLPRFVAAWRAEGFDPTLDFFAQCVKSAHRPGTSTPRLHPNDVATLCLRHATLIFEVSFSGRTVDDDEHGDRHKLSARFLADYYRSPAIVLAIVYERLRGARRTDDVLTPNLADEIALRLKSA